MDGNWKSFRYTALCKNEELTAFWSSRIWRYSIYSRAFRPKFNWNALTHEAELVLKGKYTDDDITKVQQIFIDHLQRVTLTDKFVEKIMYEDMKRKMKLWRERTSTSPVVDVYVIIRYCLFLSTTHSLMKNDKNFEQYKKPYPKQWQMIIIWWYAKKLGTLLLTD